MAYLGVSPSNGVRKVHTYTATASQTTFSGAGAENISLSYRDSTYIDVYQNGVKLGDADYTATSGTSVVLGTGASISDIVVVVVYDVFSVADTVSKTDGGQFDGAVTFAGAFTSLGIDDNADATAITIDSSENVTFASNITAEGGDYLFRNSSGNSTLSIIADTSNSSILKLGDTADFDIGQIEYNHSSNFLAIKTNDSERMRIDSSGNVGIGDTTPDGGKLHVTNSTGAIGYFESTQASANVENIILNSTQTNSSANLSFQIEDGTTAKGQVRLNGDNSIAIHNGTSLTERMRIDSSGKVGIGTSSPSEIFEVNSGTGNIGAKIVSTDSLAVIAFKDNSTSDVQFLGANGDNLVFHTGSSASEHMRIDSSGNVGIGVTSDPILTTGSSPRGQFFQGANAGITSTVYQASALKLNRLNNDGNLVDLRQAGVLEGSISVSGTTVSYNGGHLSRWSQLKDNTRDNTIVKGTVMTNLDQMAEWTTDGVTEDNEQLNCMAVSSVEGDANVAGVFVNWDNDDDVFTNDMNVAMTGDMVIRIAKETTVARGDLLMSAGDGTAKPQGDDIVRSKTIAKVTSTNVSHTYDDGTYLVPCVLMAC